MKKRRRRETQPDPYLDIEITTGADGDGGAPSQAAPAKEQTMVCLRGPCQHYWEMRLPFDHGNSPDAFQEGDFIGPGGQPMEVHRTCLANPGCETDLQETNVLHCSKWSPILPHERKQIEHRRKLYWEQVLKEAGFDKEGDDESAPTE